MVIEGEPLPSTIQNLLLDNENKIINTGSHKGSIITKLKDDRNSVIFSDTIEISEDKSIEIDGLRVGVEEDLAIAEKGIFEIPKSEILYSVKMDKDIINTFDRARFNTSFPYITAFLHTSCLYNYSMKHPVNHLDFVRGEILSHPVALLHHDSILVGDRAVIDDQGYPVFYNAFIIQRTESSHLDELISFAYEPIFRLNIHFIKWIIILGVEMLK